MDRLQRIVVIAFSFVVILGACDACIEEGSPLDISCSTPIGAQVTWKKDGVLVAENCEILQNYTKRLTYPEGCPVSDGLQRFNLRVVSFNSSTDLGNWACSYETSNGGGTRTHTFEQSGVCSSGGLSILIIVLVSVFVVAAVVGTVVGCLWYKGKPQGGAAEKVVPPGSTV